MSRRRTKKEMQIIQDRAFEHINSVPYKVSLRWVFYRLLQDGLYGEKGDYGSLKQAAAKWRHDGTWSPDILQDETREVIHRGIYDGTSPKRAAEDIVDRIVRMARRSHFHNQENYVEIWYEARGMTGQFRHYTEGITLRPFGGDYTIGPKYQAAKEIEQRFDQFGKPVKILYFGDRDKKGDKIDFYATFGPKGLAKWCSVDFEVVRCGLTADQAIEYDLPVNPDKPGEYQWEALTDDQANEIIATAVNRYIDVSLIDKAKDEAQERLPEYIDALREYIA